MDTSLYGPLCKTTNDSISLCVPVFQLYLLSHNRYISCAPLFALTAFWPVQMNRPAYSFACLNPITSYNEVMSGHGLQSIK